MSALVMFTRCYACQFGDHFDPPQVHTWMDKEDAEHAGHSWPLPAEIAKDEPCACKCGGGPGGCVVIGDVRLTEQQGGIPNDAITPNDPIKRGI